MERFLDEHGGRWLLDAALIRQAQAETCCQIGLARRSHSRWAALPWYLRALLLSPGYAFAWKGLACLPLPEAVRRLLRRALGQRSDWSVRQPLGRSPEEILHSHPGKREMGTCAPV
jgi:hypothetical protein